MIAFTDKKVKDDIDSGVASRSGLTLRPCGTPGHGLRPLTLRFITMLGALIMSPSGVAESAETMHGSIQVEGLHAPSAYGKSMRSSHRIRVSQVIGTVSSIDPETAETMLLKKGDALVSGTVILTGRHAYCEIQWEGATLKCWQNSAICVSPNKNNVALHKGFCSLNIGSSASKSYTVRMNTSQTTAGPGTLNAACSLGKEKFDFRPSSPQYDYNQ